MSKRRDRKVEAAVEKIESYLHEKSRAVGAESEVGADFRELYLNAVGVKKLGGRGSYIGHLAIEKGMAEGRIQELTHSTQGILYGLVTVESEQVLEAEVTPVPRAGIAS